MRHFYRSHTPPADVVVAADAFFAALGMTLVTTTARTRAFTGELGSLKISVKAEGGHYTFVEVATDQMGESRLDRNVKRFFVELHRTDDPSHALQASY
jgi:hypothetical protein